MHYEPSLTETRQMDNAYTYHAPTAEQTERYAHLRNVARSLVLCILESCPASRERSVALTELETAIMWANAAIARNE